jgi:hypothetical protein
MSPNNYGMWHRLFHIWKNAQKKEFFCSLVETTSF